MGPIDDIADENGKKMGKRDDDDVEEQLSDSYFCTQCNTSMPLAEQTEHRDWHMAIDLQASEEAASNTNATSPSSNAVPPSYSSVAHSNSVSTHYHTNPVINAANVRARDEVGVLEWYDIMAY